MESKINEVYGNGLRLLKIKEKDLIPVVVDGYKTMCERIVTQNLNVGIDELSIAAKAALVFLMRNPHGQLPIIEIEQNP